ncbi:hypothetical protein GMJAKD_07475 [Candidatus Electrothrix aarhusensis]
MTLPGRTINLSPFSLLWNAGLSLLGSLVSRCLCAIRFEERKG